MYGWTVSAATYMVIAIKYNIAEALLLSMLCGGAAWFFHAVSTKD